MSGFTSVNASSPKPTQKLPAHGASSSSRNDATDQSPKTLLGTPTFIPAALAPQQNSPPPAHPSPPSTLAPPPEVASTPVPEFSHDTSAEIPAPPSAELPPSARSLDESYPSPTPAYDPVAIAQAADAHSPGLRESWSTHSLQRPPATLAQPSPDSPNKRKRSASNDGRSQLPTKRIYDQPSETRPSPSPVNSLVDLQTNDSHQHGPHAQSSREASPDSDTQSPSPSYPTVVSVDPNQQQASPRQSQTHQDYTPITPQANDRDLAQYHDSYSDHRSSGVVQHDPKKRKRNFSNRTKTGCLTCRRRKKKCDEAKPECNNCIKGAFVCAGYPPQRGATGWPKMLENKPGGVPLESKDPSYVPPGAYGMPPAPYPGALAGHTTSNATSSLPVAPSRGVKREPLPQYRGQSLRIDPPKNQTASAPRDDRTPASAPTQPPPPPASSSNGNVASPEHKPPPSLYTPANPYPTPVSANTQPPAFGDRPTNDYQRGHNDSHTPRSSHMAQPSIHLSESPTAHPPPVSSAQMAAQMALAQAHPQPGQGHNQGHNQSQSQSQNQGQSHMTVVPYDQRRPTQKEEMLGGGYFFQFDKELCIERERASTACWRFNTLTSPPSNGVSAEERARLFLEILQPRESIHFPTAESSSRSSLGRVGRHVSVETPFYCDYGYNITIGNNVLIGRSCTFNDAARVQVGDNTIIGPNVSIYTVELSTDPKHRQGGQGAQLGKGVIIDSDCWIGGGAIIMPGKVIGKGATVGAGSVVTKDVPPFTVVAGNPARVLRGVSSL